MPTRKDIRLKNYDYSHNGAYFVTVCTKNKMCIFWENNDKYKPFAAKNGDGSNVPDANVKNVSTTNANVKNVQIPNVGAHSVRPSMVTDTKIHLSEFGKAVKNSLKNINVHYPMVYVDKYVIMPNHIHAIIRIDLNNSAYDGFGGRTLCAPTLSLIIKHFKEYVTKQIGFSVWQKSFHDRILRNEHEYYGAWQYIETNPANWENDELFINENNIKEK